MSSELTQPPRYVRIAIDFAAAWERIKKVTGWTKYADLQRFLGIKSGSVHGAKKRGTMPIEWFHKLASAYEINLDWLIHGVGPIMSKDAAEFYAKNPIKTTKEQCIFDVVNSVPSIPDDVRPVIEAVIEVMLSDDEGTKLALAQNAFTFQQSVRRKREIEELKHDIKIIKKRLFGEADKDLKTEGLREGENATPGKARREGGQ